jgi:hypothetical protein
MTLKPFITNCDKYKLHVTTFNPLLTQNHHTVEFSAGLCCTSPNPISVYAWPNQIKRQPFSAGKKHPSVNYDTYGHVHTSPAVVALNGCLPMSLYGEICKVKCNVVSYFPQIRFCSTFFFCTVLL